MIRGWILPDYRLCGGLSVGSRAAMVAPLVLLLRLMQQPEVIGDYQSHGHDGNADDQHQASTLVAAELLRILGGAFGTAAGFFG